jgi:hypothetical protein
MLLTQMRMTDLRSRWGKRGAVDDDRAERQVRESSGQRKSSGASPD